MDIEKLSLQPQELDKHTGRIIIPQSKEELERLASIPLTKKRDTAPVDTEVENRKIQSPAPISPPVQKEKRNEGAQIPRVPPVSNESSAHYSSSSRKSAVAGSSSEPFFTQLKIMGLCQLFIVLPLALVVLFLLSENRELNNQYNSLSQDLVNIKASASSRNSLQGSGSNTLEKELGALRNQIFELNSTMESFEVVIDEPESDLEPELLAEGEVAQEEPIEVSEESVVEVVTEVEPEVAVESEVDLILDVE